MGRSHHPGLGQGDYRRGFVIANGHAGVTGIAVRRGRGGSVSMTRGAGGAGSGVKTAVGATCGADGSNAGSARIVTALANAIASVFAWASQLSRAPRQRASGAKSTQAASPAARTLQRRSPRRAVSVPPRTSTRSTNCATSAAGATTCPAAKLAGGALGTKAPSTSTATSTAR